MIGRGLTTTTTTLTTQSQIGGQPLPRRRNGWMATRRNVNLVPGSWQLAAPEPYSSWQLGSWQLHTCTYIGSGFKGETLSQWKRKSGRRRKSPFAGVQNKTHSPPRWIKMESKKWLLWLAPTVGRYLDICIPVRGRACLALPSCRPFHHSPALSSLPPCRHCRSSFDGSVDGSGTSCSFVPLPFNPSGSWSEQTCSHSFTAPQLHSFLLDFLFRCSQPSLLRREQRHF